MNQRTETEIKKSLMLFEARRWIGAKEQGKNKGEIISIFQKAVDGVACGEPWCMGFVFNSILFSDRVFNEVMGPGSGTKLFKSEHCLSVWDKSPKELRCDRPEVGTIAIWRYQGTQNGHTGIVTKINGNIFETIEGNTSSSSEVVREGEGVFLKKRAMLSGTKMTIVGFLKPWG